MFIGLFETFIGLMSVFSYTGASYARNDVIKLNTLPNTVNTYLPASNQAGTSVMFEIDYSHRQFLHNDADINSSVEYTFYSNPGSFNSEVCTYNFQAEIQDGTGLFRIKNTCSYTDVFNLKIGIIIDGYSESYTHYQYAFQYNLKYVTDEINTPTTYYSNYFPATWTDFWLDDGYITLTIVTAPMNDEEWSGTYQDGYNDGYDDGFGIGQQDGYANGYQDASSQDTTAATIFTGIVTIGLMPINFFLGVLNFEVFGINIGALVSAFLTIAIVLIIVRIIFSGGNGSSDGGK